MGCNGSTAVDIADEQQRFHDQYKLGKKLGGGAFGQASFFEKHLFYMVMEKCDCSLMDRLVQTATMAEADLAEIFVEMLRGIQHVHSVGIVHRDIKPDNFLLSGATVKLCDFGLAAKMPARGVLTGVYGTAPYMSPEMLRGGGYGQLTDVWSFGTTAFLMIHGELPYLPRQPGGAAMKKAILAGRPGIKFVRPADEEPLFRLAFVDRATPFLQALLQRNPATRSSAAGALELPFLSLERQDSKKMNLSAAEMRLASAICRARMVAQEIRKPADPIVQHDLDELLQRLQKRHGTSGYSSSPRSFSETAGDVVDELAGLKPQPCDERIGGRNEARHSTHSGVVAPAADCNSLRGLGLDDVLDAVSTATPGSGGDSYRSAGSSPSPGCGHPRANTAAVPA